MVYKESICVFQKWETRKKEKNIYVFFVLEKRKICLWDYKRVIKEETWWKNN